MLVKKNKNKCLYFLYNGFAFLINFAKLSV